MPKKSSGEGSITHRRDGRWQASLQVNGVRRTVYAKTKREAQAKLRDLQRQADTGGGLTDAGGRTVSDLIDAWLASASNLKNTTTKQYRLFFDTYARRTIGKTRIDKVTPDALQHLYANLSPSVADRVHRVLHRAFAVAMLWRWLPSNPCDRVLKPAYQSNRPNLWTRSELDIFLEATAENWLHPLWVLLLGTGCRLGEALALRWDNVELGLAITVDGTLHHMDGEWIIGKPKTAGAKRTVILPATVNDALQHQKTQQATWQEAAGPDWQESVFVFTGKTGKPLHRSVPAHALKRECEHLGLPPMTPHGLRHLHASLLLDEGVPITAVSTRLGHANPQITMKFYAHSLAGQDRRAADAIGEVLTKGDDIEPSAENTE